MVKLVFIELKDNMIFDSLLMEFIKATVQTKIKLNDIDCTILAKNLRETNQARN